MNVKVLLSYHKPAFLLKNEILTPIHVGRAIPKSMSKDGVIDEESYSWLHQNMIGDDTGDNISVKNRFYNELTCLYWAWKNHEKLNNPEYIGFMHYRRQFIFNESKQNKFANYPFIFPPSQYKIKFLLHEDSEELFSEDQIFHALKGVDVLIPKAVKMHLTVYEQYVTQKKHHIATDLDIAIQIIEKIYPEYSQSVAEYMTSREHYLWNMSVMRWEIFNTYCEWLFSILNEMENTIDFSERTISQCRAFAYIAERLTGIFIKQLQKNSSIKIAERYSIYEEITAIPMNIASLFQEKSIPVIFATDDNYLPYFAVTLQSLIAHSNSSNKYEIFILNENISDHNKEKIYSLVTDNIKHINIQFIDIAPYLKGINPSILYSHKHFSKSTYYRFFLARIFKHLNKAIYLDCDIAVFADVAELYNISLNGQIAGAVKDFEILRASQKNSESYHATMDYLQIILGLKNPSNYFQAGVLLLDLEKMRQISFEHKCLEKLAEIKTPKYVDQDILNVVLEGNIEFLPIKWNIEWQLPIEHPSLIEDLPISLYSEFMDAYKSPYILHFSGEHKPWKEPHNKSANYFWKYAKTTPFYEEILYKSLLEGKNSVADAAYLNNDFFRDNNLESLEKRYTFFQAIPFLRVIQKDNVKKHLLWKCIPVHTIVCKKNRTSKYCLGIKYKTILSEQRWDKLKKDYTLSQVFPFLCVVRKGNLRKVMLWRYICLFKTEYKEDKVFQYAFGIKYHTGKR